MRTRITTVALVALILSTASSALAAVNPTVSTGGHSALTPTSVTLLGKVNPHGVQTSYHFEYGTTKGYGTQTGPIAAGNGTATSNASAAIVGLTPNTTYHYRIVAVTAAGSILGGDQALKTPKQPLGLSLLANPNPVPFGASTTVAATLTGTDRANRNIVLQQRPFPYTAPFAQVGNVVVTNSLGVAPFPILAQQLNTQYRALVQGTSVVAADHHGRRRGRRSPQPAQPPRALRQHGHVLGQRLARPRTARCTRSSGSRARGRTSPAARCTTARPTVVEVLDPGEDASLAASSACSSASPTGRTPRPRARACT